MTVIFRVDMACLTFEQYSAGVFVAGDFQGWNQCTTQLSDPNGDEIYEGSWVIPAGSNPNIYLKFNRSGTGSPEWYAVHNEQGYWLVVTCVPGLSQHGHWGCFCMTIDQILPVEFGNFDAIAGDREVTLNWNTLSETNNARFDVERDGDVVGQVPSAGGTSGHNYSWMDRNLTNGRTYGYSLVAVDVNGSRVTVATESVTPHSALITEYALSGNYPNPFNPTTSFSYSLKDAGLVRLNVYDVAGRLVNELVNSDQAMGTYTLTFDGSALPSGIYYYRLNVNGFSATQKMVLMK